MRALVILALLATPLFAESRPGILREIGFDQNLGAQVPLDTVVRDEEGREARLGDFFRSRPVVLSLNYYSCPMLCTVALNGLASALNVLSFNAGREFEALTVSFDPKDTSDLARAKKKTYLSRYKRPGAEEGWRFLTADAPAIAALTRAVGFRYAWDNETQQFAHPAGVVILTPGGRIARYLYGIEYAPNDLRLALVEATGGKIGTPVDQVLLFCYEYDPATGRYGATIIRIVRLAGVLTVVSLLTFVLTMWRREQVKPAGAG